MDNTNLYKPPRSDITPATSEPFGEIKIFSTQGRLGRVRYIGYLVGLGLLTYLVMALPVLLTSLTEGGDVVKGIMGVTIILVSIVGFVVSILLAIQRLHDFDASAWWSALVIIPLANLVLYLVLMIMPGTQGSNRFGNPPPPNTTGVIILALILPLIMVVGIVAAIMIPAYMDYEQRAQEAVPNSMPAQPQ